MPRYQAPRGTRDLLPAEMVGWHLLQDVARELSELYGYGPIETPLFEESAVFERAIGAGTDVVEKELFRIRSPGGDEDRWALRPEATAGICRAYIEHGMHTLPQPVRLTTFGPMFRYDRPQAGRYRQFWQWNVEAIGDAGPAIDAELIELGLRFLRRAGLANVQLELNSIGDAACRPAYIERLTDFLRGHREQLPELERRRLESNPLRVLDSKDERLTGLLSEAPAISASLCDECRSHFDDVRRHLDRLGVAYELAPRLVRGLDYYTRTAFEFYQPDARGQQSALGGGGRYDGLIGLLGAKQTPAIGFAMGIDRIAAAITAAGSGADSGAGTQGTAGLAPLAVVVGADPAATDVRLALATKLRAEGVAARAELAPRKLARQLDGAARDSAHFAVVVGDELEAGQVQLRDLQAGTQRTVNLADLARELKRARASHHHG